MRPGRRRGSELLEEPSGYRWSEPRVAALDGANCVHQIIRRDVFEQEAARTSLDRGEDVLVQIEGGQHQHADLGSLREQPAGGLDAVQPRHPDIHEHDVRSGLERLLDTLYAIAGLSDDDETGSFQDHREADPHQFLIVGYDNTRHAATMGRVARTMKPRPAWDEVSSWPP